MFPGYYYRIDGCSNVLGNIEDDLNFARQSIALIKDRRLFDDEVIIATGR